MTTELQAAAAEIERKMPKRMTEEDLECDARNLCSAVNVRDWNYQSQTVHYMTKENAIKLAKKYRGEL